MGVKSQSIGPEKAEWRWGGGCIPRLLALQVGSKNPMPCVWYSFFTKQNNTKGGALRLCCKALWNQKILVFVFPVYVACLMHFFSWKTYGMQGVLLNSCLYLIFECLLLGKYFLFFLFCWICLARQFYCSILILPLHCPKD